MGANLRMFLVPMLACYSVACSSNASGQADETDTAGDVPPDTEVEPQRDSDIDLIDTDLSDASSDTESADEVEVSDFDVEEALDADVPTAEDGAPCWGIQYPQLGCPCDPSRGPAPCCVRIAYGLECSTFFREWTDFQDCGCDFNPICGDEPPFTSCELPPPEPEE